MKDKTAREKDETKDPKNLLEWGVFFMGLLLVIGIFAYLGYQTYHYKPSSPELTVELRPEPTKAQPYRYHLVVRNTGGETAESVEVEVVMHEGGAVKESAVLQLMYVPQESEREGWVNFSQKPASDSDLSARVSSYQKP